MKQLIILAMAFMPFVAFGASGPGGQYKYYNTDVTEQLERGQNIANSMVYSIPDQDWDRFFTKGKATKAELSNILKNIKFSPAKRGQVRNNMPLVLNYMVENGEKKIEVLGEFYDLVLYEKVPGNLKTSAPADMNIAQNFVHEALHHFGYNQKEAWELSGRLMSLQIYDVFRYCSQLYEKVPDGKCLYAIRGYDLKQVSEISGQFIGWLRSESYSPIEIYLYSLGWGRARAKLHNSEPVIFDLTSDGLVKNALVDWETKAVSDAYLLRVPSEDAKECFYLSRCERRWYGLKEKRGFLGRKKYYGYNVKMRVNPFSVSFALYYQLKLIENSPKTGFEIPADKAKNLVINLGVGQEKALFIRDIQQ